MTASVACHGDLAVLAGTTARQLAVPWEPLDDGPWLAQSLSDGTAGIALLHVERAHARHGTWRQAHAWITAATTGEVSASDTAGLFLGLPAVAFVLDAAARGTGRYQAALARIDSHLAMVAGRRVQAGMARIAAGQLPGFHEYDVFFGLTGIGALLLRRDPSGNSLERVLQYLVALTNPLRIGGDVLPGWWCGHDPRRRQSFEYPGGHGNFGMAHGITGPLALLGQAARHGISVNGQNQAIATILAWLDAWRQDSPAGPWWPEWITRTDLAAGRPAQRRPNRPSWCYGTPGIARAAQVATIALGDTRAQHQYEQALAQCLQDPTQIALISTAGLCHGAAGLYMTAWRAARDTASPALTQHLPKLADLLRRTALAEQPRPKGFLDGDAGTALALHAAASSSAPISGWDACLLIS